MTREKSVTNWKVFFTPCHPDDQIYGPTPTPPKCVRNAEHIEVTWEKPQSCPHLHLNITPHTSPAALQSSFQLFKACRLAFFLSSLVSGIVYKSWVPLWMESQTGEKISGGVESKKSACLHYIFQQKLPNLSVSSVKLHHVGLEKILESNEASLQEQCVAHCLQPKSYVFYNWLGLHWSTGFCVSVLIISGCIFVRKGLSILVYCH